MSRTLADQLNESQARMLVVPMRLEVLDQLIDSPRQEGYLDLRRTGVLVMNMIFLDDGVLLSLA
jgi:hypothetical protein